MADSEADMSYYILDNETQKLIDEIKNGKIKTLNAVMTRSQDKSKPKDNESERENEKTSSPETGEIEKEVNDKVTFETWEKDLLPEVVNDQCVRLAKVGRSDFKREQESDPSLQVIRKKEIDKKSHYEMRDSLIIRKTKDHRGFEKIQLVIPSKYRAGILNACQEGNSAHVGEMKTKDKIFKVFLLAECDKRNRRLREYL